MNYIYEKLKIQLKTWGLRACYFLSCWLLTDTGAEENGREYFRLGAESYSSLGRVRKKEKKIARPLLDVVACGQVSGPRLYPLNGEVVGAKMLASKHLSIENLFYYYTISLKGLKNMGN